MSSHDSRDSTDRRRDPRAWIPGIKVRHHSIAATLQNLSLHGMALETTTGLRIGGRYRFELEAATRTVGVEVVVRWCRLHAVRRSPDGEEFEPLFLAGVAIEPPGAIELRSFRREGPLSREPGALEVRERPLRRPDRVPVDRRTGLQV